MTDFHEGQTQGGTRRGPLTYALWGVALIGAAAAVYVMIHALIKPAGGHDLKALAHGEMAKLEPAATPAPLPDTPLLTDLAQTAEQRAMFAFLSDTVSIDQPYVLPPGTRPELLKVFREGFDAMTKDAGFLDEAKKEGLDMAPLNGEALAGLVDRILGADPAVVKAVVAVIGAE